MFFRRPTRVMSAIWGSISGRMVSMYTLFFFYVRGVKVYRRVLLSDNSEMKIAFGRVFRLMRIRKNDTRAQFFLCSNKIGFYTRRIDLELHSCACVFRNKGYFVPCNLRYEAAWGNKTCNMGYGCEKSHANKMYMNKRNFLNFVTNNEVMHVRRGATFLLCFAWVWFSLMLLKMRARIANKCHSA